jgi:hypothetical protein
VGKQEWYFVSHLLPGEPDDESRPFEVQVLRHDGAAEDFAQFDQGCESLTVGGRVIPPAVLAAVKDYPVGCSYYVGPGGEPLDMWGHPIPREPWPDREELAEQLLDAARDLAEMPSPGPRGALIRARAILSVYPGTAAAPEARELVSRHGGPATI